MGVDFRVGGGFFFGGCSVRRDLDFLCGWMDGLDYARVD